MPGRLDDSERSREAVQRWSREQEVQRLIAQTPASLVGERVTVYRQEGTTQFYTAVVNSCNEKTKVLKSFSSQLVSFRSSQFKKA